MDRFERQHIGLANAISDQLDRSVKEALARGVPKSLIRKLLSERMEEGEINRRFAHARKCVSGYDAIFSTPMSASHDFTDRE